jgi:excinuclease ABC subunit C
MQGHLEGEMKKAAAAQEYEKAAQLRDLLSDLNRTTKKTNRFQRIPYSLPVAVEPERDLTELGQILGLPGPPQRIEGIDISNISGTFVVASLVAFRNGRPDRANYRRFKIKSVEGQDDFASVAEVVRRRYTRLLKEGSVARVASDESKGEGTGKEAQTKLQSTIIEDKARPSHDESTKAIPSELQTVIDDVSAASRRKPGRSPNTDSAAADVRAHRAPYAPASESVIARSASDATSEDSIPDQPNIPSFHRSNLPDLILIDGGRGQLNAACAELEKLGLSHIPILGLAKEFEEIYRPGEKEPLRLSQDSGALKLLQRVRDESHRLANTYNATLRLRKISESILDEFPNIGERRKAALLKKFGSIQRMRLATVEQLAEVPGFGGKAAAELKAFLEARTT